MRQLELKSASTITRHAVNAARLVMRCFLFSWLLLAATPAWAQEDVEREVALPLVTLVQPPEVPKLETVELAEGRAEEIEGLISDLSEVAESDLSINSPYQSPCFVPVGRFGFSGEWTGKPVEVSNSIRKLTEIGPEALPFLLAALGDESPTKIVIESVFREGVVTRGLAFDEELHGNPANPKEHFILKLNRYPYSASIRPNQDFFVPPEMEAYRVKIGDVCLVVIGQIVGRKYECLTTPHVKSVDIQVCSPVHRKAVRNRIRQIWATKNPRQKLLESLVLDFSTRGLQQMDSLDYWSIGNDFQIESIKRLLYYYPDFAVPLIVQRIDGLQFSDDFVEDCVRNGLRADDLVDAVAWSQNADIPAALTRLEPRATENTLREALRRALPKTPEK